MTNYYKLLQVDPSADPEVIAAAYRRLAVKNHPDTNGSSPEAKARMQALNEAYAVLSDPVQRAAYDRSMASQSATNTTARPRPTVSSTPPPVAAMPNVKPIGLYVAIVVVLLLVVRLGFSTVGPEELVVVLVVSLLLVQPVREWLSRRSRR
jgi:preprotein translocase subunit Sec63